MATRKPNARVVLNMAKLNEVQQALAYGLKDLGETIAREAAAKVPTTGTDPLHVREEWGVAIYVDGKKVQDVSYDGTATAKPREFRAPKGLSGIVGFGFPGRFLEVGTSDTAAQPFLSPAAQQVAGRAVAIVKAGAAPHLAKP